MTSRTQLTRRDFFHDVVQEVRARLPEDLATFQASATRNLVKLYYGHPRLHYEVWTNARDQHIEIGLHFEDSAESTDRLLAFFDAHIVEIKHELGPTVELERWTTSWGHIFELLPYQPLTEALVQEVAERLARMIIVLQPLLVEADARARLGSATEVEGLSLASRRRGRHWRRTARNRR